MVVFFWWWVKILFKIWVLFLELRVFVDLFKIKIGGFFIKVLVIVKCCFCFFERLVLNFFKIVK